MSRIRIAMVDSGWDSAAVEPRVLPGVTVADTAVGTSWVPDAHGAHDAHGHGTHCARLVLELTPVGTITPVRIFDTALQTSLTQLLAALHWCADQRFDVVNLSLATTERTGARDLYLACAAVVEAGGVVVAAGDNGGRECYPAMFDHVIGVAAAAFTTPKALRYRADAALECLASGVPPQWYPHYMPLATSFAAARATALLVTLLDQRDDRGLVAARRLLADYGMQWVAPVRTASRGRSGRSAAPSP